MKILKIEEINNIAIKFIQIRDKIEKTKNKKNKNKFVQEFKQFQEYLIKSLSYLVILRTNKYRKFGNHSDLTQEGFKGLCMALKTYDPKKGDFLAWAKKYIDTRIIRAANSHSTIKVPLNKIKDNKPFKTGKIPTIIDESLNPLLSIEKEETEKSIRELVECLPDRQKKIIKMAFGFINNKQFSIKDISEELNVSKNACVELLEEAKKQLQAKLLEADINN